MSSPPLIWSQELRVGAMLVQGPEPGPPTLGSFAIIPPTLEPWNPCLGSEGWARESASSIPRGEHGASAPSNAILPEEGHAGSRDATPHDVHTVLDLPSLDRQTAKLCIQSPLAGVAGRTIHPGSV